MIHTGPCLKKTNALDKSASYFMSKWPIVQLLCIKVIYAGRCYDAFISRILLVLLVLLKSHSHGCSDLMKVEGKC